MFTGMVSTSALADTSGRLVLEHYDRLSFELSRLIENHLDSDLADPGAFAALIERCERVNITTDDENHRVQQTLGDYPAAHIELVPWVSAARETRELLWKCKLRGKVANASEFRPEAAA